MMLEEPQRRNYSEHTARYYIRTVEDFARRFNRPPDRLGLRHIREYQAELFQKQKLSSGAVTNSARPTCGISSQYGATVQLFLESIKTLWNVSGLT